MEMENGVHYSESNRDLYNMSENTESERLKSKEYRYVYGPQGDE